MKNLIAIIMLLILGCNIHHESIKQKFEIIGTAHYRVYFGSVEYYSSSQFNENPVLQESMDTTTAFFKYLAQLQFIEGKHLNVSKSEAGITKSVKLRDFEISVDSFPLNENRYLIIKGRDFSDSIKLTIAGKFLGICVVYPEQKVHPYLFVMSKTYIMNGYNYDISLYKIN